MHCELFDVIFVVHPATFTEVTRTSAASRVVAVIPARYHSTRFPGKALADIAGLPMIEHVYRRAVRAEGVHDVIVATDDQRIAEVVTMAGGDAIMTSPDCATAATIVPGSRVAGPVAASRTAAPTASRSATARRSPGFARS